MHPTVRKLFVIRNVRDRLDALSKKSVSKEAMEQLKEEVESLSFCLDSLSEKMLNEMVIVIGEKDRIENIPLIKEVPVLRDSLSVEGDLAYVMLKRSISQQTLCKKLFDIFVPYDWHGNPLTQKQVPSFALGKRYFASADDGKKGVLIELSVLLEEHVKEELKKWLVDFYRAIRWDEAKPIQKGEGNGE